jgi:pentatricopeptide repeat protein
MNSILDAYVNCKSLEDARSLFQSMKEMRGDDRLGFRRMPRPNGRTHNIFLKGLANEGLLEEADAISNEMMRSGMWDSVTTNTLVHAAIVRGDYDRAESMLHQHTALPVSGDSDHPNVEAYTELIDAYAKSSQLDRALILFQTMKERKVDPNEITFTCLISGIAQKKEVAQARNMIRYMSSVGVKPTCATYSALISGLLVASPAQVLHDVDVDEALRILRDMIQAKIRPNPAIVSTLVRALAQCSPPRVREARLLVDKLERDGMIAAGSVRVATALVQAYGVARDAVGCVEAFRSIRRMDTVAVNAFLDACCRCGRDRLAFDTFDYYFRRKSSLARPRLKPDVISYSTLISSLLKQANSSTIKKAQSMYEEMKVQFSVLPDNTMIDLVLKAFVRIGRSRSLTKDESMFVVRVLRDAERLAWGDGQLLRRKRAVRALVGSKLRDVWLAMDESEDDLFKRKGWNQVDSGFRLWGSPLGQTDAAPQSKKVVDQFLESKGWNDVDSGFRII